MNNKITISLDDHVNSINTAIQPVTDDFFYTRLKGRMQQKHEYTMPFFLKPGFVIGCLLAMLMTNMIFLNRQRAIESPNTRSQMERFGKEFDLFISTPY